MIGGSSMASRQGVMGGCSYVASRQGVRGGGPSIVVGVEVGGSSSCGSRIHINGSASNDSSERESGS